MTTPEFTNEYRVALLTSAASIHMTNPDRPVVDIAAELHKAVEQALFPGDGPEAAQAPAVSVKKSKTADHLVCLDCGKKFKSLKRHIAAAHDLNPDQYRTRWELPPTYPMVAANYSETRSNLARKNKLGQKP